MHTIIMALRGGERGGSRGEREERRREGERRGWEGNSPIPMMMIHPTRSQIIDGTLL